MLLPLHIRRVAVVLPLVLGATLLPVVGGRPASGTRHWRLGIASPAAKFRAPDNFGLVGVSWEKGARAPLGVKVRTSRDGRVWSDWQHLEYGRDEGPDGATIHSTVPLWTGTARFVGVRFSGRVPAGANVHLVDPGSDPTEPGGSAFARPGKPGIITRAQWGADESIRKGKPSYAEPLRLAVIHHTATANSYSKSESAGIVRSIYAYHVKSNGWDDIGYNFLVDRFGQIFEGRYGGVNRTVVGAHAKGFNKYNVGVAVLGTFDSASPPAAAMESLKRLVGWRLDVGYVDPQGTTKYTSGGSSRYSAGTKVALKNITSHRDVGNTSCPGALLYDTLGSLRGAVAAYGDPKIYHPRLSAPIMTPNRDGYADTVTLTTRFSSTVSWRVDVLDPAGKIKKTSKGSGASASVGWSGHNAGADAPHDSYRFRITGSNANGSLRNAYFTVKLWRYPIGTLFKTTSRGWVAVLERGRLRHLLTKAALTSRYRSSEVVRVPEELRKVYPGGSDIGFRDGSVVRADDKLWIISDSRKRPVSTATLDALGFDREAIIDTAAKYLSPHPTGTTVTAGGEYPSGSALKGSDLREMRIVGDNKRPFLTQAIRLSYAIRDVDLAGPADAEVIAASTRQSWGFRDGTLIRGASSAAVYVIERSYRRHITSGHRLAAMGYSRANIRDVTDAEVALHNEGAPL